MKHIWDPRQKTYTCLADYILELDVPKEDKDMLLSLTPQSYTGVASKIFDLL